LDTEKKKSSAIYCECNFREFRESQNNNLKKARKDHERTENFNKTPTPFDLGFVERLKNFEQKKIKNHQFLSNLETSISQGFRNFISAIAINLPHRYPK
jgi:hypothetical protein